ncbi:MAG: Rossmann-like and DUF2520 domain-containing protein [Adhaeribacter sp.]
MKLFFLGSGNVATHLSKALAGAGHQVLGVYSRQLPHAAGLANFFPGALALDSPDFTSLPAADLYLVCLRDDAVAGLLQQARFPAGSFVAHTSGSLPLAAIPSGAELRPGVFYPIQTFSKSQEVDLFQTPIALEAADAAMASLLAGLAASISSKVVWLSGQERQYLHLAAVFACNFSNHLLGIGHDLMARHQLDPALLHPLIEATFAKALRNPPFQVQTGPAVRGDATILERHQHLLQGQPRYGEIYRLLSESIRQQRDLPAAPEGPGPGGSLPA